MIQSVHMLKTATRRTTRASFERMDQDVKQLRSLFISLIGEDAEGKYCPEFVQRVVKSSKEKPTHQFRGSASFLAELKRV